MATAPQSPDLRDRLLALLYAATILVSAFLLFQVQPLVSKRILPWFGGSPAVWTTCMLFFQLLLFAGYAYAHFSQCWLRPRWQAIVHMVLLFVAVSLLHVIPDASWEPPGGDSPVWQILVILAVSVGLPFFVLSTTAPLVQAWFARSFPGRPPYRLYALSNFGSLLALVSYPLVFEREFDLSQQGRYWSWVFIAFAALGGYTTLRLWLEGDEKREGQGETPAQPSTNTAAGLANGSARASLAQFVLWLLLPAFASVALLATTNHVCTDIAVVPFLWVVPLALYLITFIIAFDHPRWFRPTLMAALTLAAIYGSALVYHQGIGTIELYQCGSTGRLYRLVHDAVVSPVANTNAAAESPQIRVGFRPFLALNFAAMFGICLLCHGELARRRPHPHRLTAYFLALAAGGALGGMAVTLVAPQLFKTYFEWRLVMFVSAIAAITLLLNAAVNRSSGSDPPQRRPFTHWRLAALAVLLLPTGLVLLDLVEYLNSADADIVYRERNFFGTLTIRDRAADNPATRSLVLQHGATTHGTQFTDPARRALPTTYYSSVSGIGRTLNQFRETPNLGGLRVGAVGLGTGTLAAYIGDGDAITFYDINPTVIKIAAGGRWFKYLSDCSFRGGLHAIKLGDARLSLRRELAEAGRKRYHVLALDAFSGDAVPAHLLTEEAFDIYLNHLTTAATDGVDGALAVHISNRYLDLEPVVRGAAEHFGIQSRYLHNDRNYALSIYSSNWIILTHNAALLAALEPFATPPSTAAPPAILWTDARSNLFDVLK